MAYSPVKTMLAALALTVAYSVVSQADDHGEHWRLFIGDHTQPIVHAVDL